jgi:hypothetical protein
LKPSVVLYGLLAVGLGIAEHVWQGRQVADLRGELAALRNRPIDARPHSGTAEGASYAASRRAAPLSVQPGHETPSVPAPPACEDRPEESEAVKRAKWEEATRAHQTSVEAGFAAEKVDRAWAAEVRQDLRDRAAALLPSSSSLRDVDCRSSMCRMEMVVADAAAAQRYIASAFASPEHRIWNGSLFVMPRQTNPDGTVGVVMYLGREGTSLPE